MSVGTSSEAIETETNRNQHTTIRLCFQFTDHPVPFKGYTSRKERKPHLLALIHYNSVRYSIKKACDPYLESQAWHVINGFD